MNAELVLDRMAARIVARAERAVVVDEELRHQEQRDAFRAGRRIGQAREHEMDDVVGEVMLAVGDEDLRAGDAIGAVGARSAFVRSAPTSEPACGSVSCIVPIHSPVVSLARYFCFSASAPCLSSASIAPMVSTGPMPNAIEAEFHISMQAELSACGSPCPPHSSGAASPFQPPCAQAV